MRMLNYLSCFFTQSQASAEAFLAHTISGSPLKPGKQSNNNKSSSKDSGESQGSAIEQPLPACAS